MTDVTLSPPTERTCERCGRRDRWDGTDGHWAVDDPGRPYCLHVWDVDGSYNPIETAGGGG